MPNGAGSKLKKGALHALDMSNTRNMGPRSQDRYANE